MTLEQLSWFVDDVVKRKLQGAARASAEIDRIGGVDREIRVELDPDRLLALGITAADVNRQLRATNVDLAGGTRRVRRAASRRSARSPARARSRRSRRPAIVAARRPQGPARRPRDGHRRHRGAAHPSHASTATAGRRLRDLPRQGRERRRRRRRAVDEEDRRAVRRHIRTSAISLVDDSVDLHRRQLRIGDADPARGRGCSR